LTILLQPLMGKTASTAETGTVRAVWTASHVADLFGPPGGVHFVRDDAQGSGNALKIKEDFAGGPSYAQSKAADIMLGVECAKRWGKEGILSVSLNPGNLRSELVRDRSWFEQLLVQWVICHPPAMGAWTELYAGKWIVPPSMQSSDCGTGARMVAMS
jgi:retinol dehydrogenase-12